MAKYYWSDEFLQTLSYSEATIDLARYWHDLPRHGEEVAPRRNDFRLTEIAHHLDEIYMSKWVSETELVILASGTKLIEILGDDLTGKNIYQQVPLDYAQPQRDYYNTLRSIPCAGALTRWGASLKEKPFVYRTMQLPLLGDTGKADFFVGTGAIRTSIVKGDQLTIEDKVYVEQHARVFLDIGAGVPDQ